MAAPQDINPTNIPSDDDVVLLEELPPSIHSLPSPETVRETARQLGFGNTDRQGRPPPVKFPSLGLIVKYGCEVSLAEARCLVLVRKHLRTVPVPEVYGWRMDGKQSFIYMELIAGPTLQESWDELDDDARVAICQELRTMVKAWRGLFPDVCGNAPYIG